jgi:hypothetical protein
MTITNDSNCQTIDMGEFSLNLEEKKKDMSFQKFRDTAKHQDPIVRQAFKETTKIAKKKTDEEIKEHQEYVLILSRYGQSKRFQEHLKMMGFNLSVTHLKKCEIEELKEIHQRVKVSIDNKNVSNFWEEMCLSSIQTGEAIVVNTKLGQKVKIQGLTELLRNDETFLDLIEQIELENQNITHTSPYVRLVYAVVSSAMKVHGVNSMLQKRLSIIKGQEPEEKTQEQENKAQESEIKTQDSSDSEETPEEKEPEILSFE